MCLMVLMMKNEKISKHYNYKRGKRERFIEKHLHGDGNIIDGFIVDRNHPDGPEVHSLTDNGVIIIHNLESGALVTKLIARPKQIERLYSNGREKPPEYNRVMELAKWHESLNYNDV